MGKLVTHLRNQWMGALALFLVLAGGTAWAATELDKNEVTSKHIKNAGVKGKDLANNAVTSPKVSNGSLLGEDFAAGELPRGPEGAPGPQGERGPEGEKGASGIKGAAGTARAYAQVSQGTCSGSPPAPCTYTESKGISLVRKSATTGYYCITAPGIDADTVPVALTVNSSTTNVPISQLGLAEVTSAEAANPTYHGCSAGDFMVRTHFNGADSNLVSFTILIP